MAIQIYNADAT